MPKYQVNYTFNGTGSVMIDAPTPEKAEDAFYSGEFSDEEEDGTDYEVRNVEEK